MHPLAWKESTLWDILLCAKLSLTRILPLDSPDIQELGHLLLEHVVLRCVVTQGPLVLKKPSRREVVTVGTVAATVVVLNRPLLSLRCGTASTDAIL